MRRRARFLEFNQRFEGKARDENLKSTLEMEMPGILIWALDGLTEVLANKQIHRTKSAIEYEVRFAETLNPVLAFVRDACVLDPDAKPYPRSELYAGYHNWHVAEISKHPLGRPNFYEALRMDFKVIAFKKIRGTDYVCGISLVNKTLLLQGPL